MTLILVVEDNALVAQLLEQQLEDLHSVIIAPDGRAGVEAARTRKPDVVLMDLTMPVMDGWTAIRALRADASTARIPIIALSGSDAEGVARALAAGADAFVPKPIDEALLRSTIQRVLTSSGSWQRPTTGAKSPPGREQKG